jgi:hypothetical protein
MLCASQYCEEYIWSPDRKGIKLKLLSPKLSPGLYFWKTSLNAICIFATSATEPLSTLKPNHGSQCSYKLQ